MCPRCVPRTFGLVDQLRHRGFGRGPHEFRGSMASMYLDMYFNSRAEYFGKSRDWLHSPAEIPDNPELDIDLTSVQYGLSSKRQIQLKKNGEMKSRGCASPDMVRSDDDFCSDCALAPGANAETGLQLPWRTLAPMAWILSGGTVNATYRDYRSKHSCTTE
jgi:hypothetical protein